MRVLIIDDELSTRESIKMLAGLSEEAGDEIYEAKNGMEGYQMIGEVHPELIFLDMNMPVMDGADLLNMLDERKFPGKIIVVSGYTDFRYTKAAILKQYVVDYIQKPIDENQIREAVQKATGRVQTGNFSHIHEKAQQEEVMFSIFIEDFPDLLKKNYNGSVELLQYFIMCQAEHQIGEIMPYENKDEIYQYACFFTMSKAGAYTLEEALKRLINKLEQRYKITAYAVYKSEAGCDLFKMYMEICEFFNYADLEGQHRVIGTKKITQIPEPKLESGLWAGELIYCGKNRNRDQYESTVRKMLAEIQEKSSGTIYERKIIISGLIYEVGRKLNEKGIHIEKQVADRMEELYSGKLMFSRRYSINWLKAFLEEIWELTGQETQEVPEKLREILHYIQGNYHKKISLSEVAERFYFNSSTVSRMFVKYMGINYIEYINTLRLEKAREMLDDSNISISEAAVKTGFENVSYFSKRFKKKYGISPQDYRNNKQ